MAADNAIAGPLETGYTNSFTRINYSDGSLATRLTTEKKDSTSDTTTAEFESSDGRFMWPAGCNSKQGGCIGEKEVIGRGSMARQPRLAGGKKQGKGDRNPLGIKDDNWSVIDGVTNTQIMRDDGKMVWVKDILQWATDNLGMIDTGVVPEPPPKPPWPPPWHKATTINNNKNQVRSPPRLFRFGLRQTITQTQHHSRYGWVTGDDITSNSNNNHYLECSISVAISVDISTAVAPEARCLDRKFRLPPPPWLSYGCPGSNKSCLCFGSRFRPLFRQCCELKAVLNRIAAVVQPPTIHNATTSMMPTSTPKEMNINVDDAEGGSGKRGLDDGGKQATVVSPKLQKTTGDEDPMDEDSETEEVVGGAKTLFDKAVEARRQQPGTSSLKTASEKKGTAKKMSFAAAVKKGNEVFVDTTILVVSALRTSNKSVVEDYAHAMKTVFRVYDSTVPKQVCIRAIDSSSTVVYKGDSMGMDAFKLAEKFVASDLMWEACTNQTNQCMDRLYEVKKDSKKEWFEFTIILGSYDIGWSDNGSIRAKLLDKNIRLTTKESPGVYTYSDWAILLSPIKFPFDEMSKQINDALAVAYRRKHCSVDPPEISIELTYPSGLFEKLPFIKNPANKKILVVTYAREDSERLIDIMPEWKSVCRLMVGRFCYFQRIPKMKDPNESEFKKQGWKGRTSDHSLMNEILCHFLLVGFRSGSFGLDKPIALVRMDGSVVHTSARKILMGLQLPAKKEGKPRFAAVGVAQTTEGVEVAFPNGPERRQLFENMAVCPAAWFLYHWMIDLNITKDSMLDEISKIFEPEYVSMAKTCVERDEDGTLYISGEAGEGSYSSTNEELNDVDWMKAAIEAVKLNQSNSDSTMENGRLYNFDEASDVGSVDTHNYLHKRFGASFQDMLDERDASAAAASQAGGASNNKTPQSDSDFVGSAV